MGHTEYASVVCHVIFCQEYVIEGRESTVYHFTEVRTFACTEVSQSSLCTAGLMVLHTRPD